MHLKILKPKKALNKAFLKLKPRRVEMEAFKKRLLTLLRSINEAETEEFHKNLIIEFLNATYYKPGYFINTKGRNDLVIHNGKSAKSSVGVIIEAKSPANKYEMLTTGNINRKAFQELVLYYLRERITHKNIEIKHLVVTNIDEWFIFNATTFDRLFAQNKNLVQQFQDFENHRLAETKTDFFYHEIAAPFIESITSEIDFTHFNFQDYQKFLLKDPKKTLPDGKTNDHKLISLFKILSPEHLLKLPFANDSNTLDQKFYGELLHIIGLTEMKVGNKKLIQRSGKKDRHSGSVIENTLIRLESLDIVSRMPKLSASGATLQERTFNVALELAITWINRILFLKLMEAQLIRYHYGNPRFAFLQFNKIQNYDDLNSLFFQVLAKPVKDRNEDVQEEFRNVPYLNSSLFEPTEMERQTIYIGLLKDDKKIPVYAQTALKENNGKRKKGELTALHYLFEFLNAYDFSSEGSEEIQEENKTLINASVLGLIFEKINGYKDGSFFTPGFITMFMSRETIRKAVIQKFNEIKKWNCTTLSELYNKIDDINEANAIVNSIKICDPAVGSGHFLVSSLNEMIAVKNDLQILQDKNGRRLKNYQVEVVNDELIVTDEEGEIFEYHPYLPHFKGRKPESESQRIQETLFHEKQTIIENCLFGVDINPNSVKICRLRLWIELLKNAYYKNPLADIHGRASLPMDLQTLPNIDINIKCGNALISRFEMDANLKKALRSNKWTIDSYRLAIAAYHHATNKTEKREMEDLILKIKQNFSTEIRMNDPMKKRLDKLSAELYHRFTGTFLFEPETPYGENQKDLDKRRKKEKEKLEKEIEKISAKMDEFKTNKIYNRSLEWRFEFPEVLNDDGDFVGFDVVIANPPYIRQKEFVALKPYLKSKYEVFNSTADLYVYFVNLGLQILKPGGLLAFIIPNKWMKSGYGIELRNFLKQKEISGIIDFGDLPVFEEATTYPCILTVRNQNNDHEFYAAEVDTLNQPKGLESYIRKNKIIMDKTNLPVSGWSLIDKKKSDLIQKIKSKGKPLSDLDSALFRGIVTGYNRAFIIDKKTKEALIEEDPKAQEVIKPVLKGRDIKRYETPLATQYLILTRRNISIEDYPSVHAHLLRHKEKLMQKAGGRKWYELQASPGATDKFEKPKIMYPDISKDLNFILDTNGHYSVNTVYNIGLDSKGLLGFLNSRLFLFYFKTISNSIRGEYLRFFTSYMETCPIPERLKTIEPLVDQVLNLKKENPKAETAPLERQMDRIIYELCDLTDEEIEMIENA